MELDMNTGNPCEIKRDFCQNCHNHYAQIRPSIKGVFVSKHFSKDVGDEGKVKSTIKEILECSHIQFTEMHKFEKHVGNYLIFRAKKDGVHIVYAIDKERKVIIFLRSFSSYSKYKKFLEDDRDIQRAISRSS